MDDFIRVPPGEFLLKRLQDKHQFPVTIINNNRRCASCSKLFTQVRQPSAELHATPEGLPMPVLYFLLLCQVCAAKYRSGGCGQEKVLVAVKKCLAREVSQ